MSATFLDTLRTTFREHAARPAVVHGGKTWTYGELEAAATAAAARLRAAAAVAPGDRVVLCTADKIGFLRQHLGALFAGAVSLPLNPRFTREELRFFLADSGAAAAMVGPETAPIIESLRGDLPNLRAVLPAGPCVDKTVEPYRPVAPQPTDACLILYSSGTTGFPKGVVHTQANVLASLRALQAAWHFTPDDVVLNVLPLFHIHGLCFATQLTLLTGGCLLIDDFEPQTTLKRIGECTVFMSVPTIYYRFLEEPGFRAAAAGWKKTRLFTCGSAPIRAEVLPDLEAILGKPVINRYGMSEAFVITSLPLDGPWPTGSVGLPLPGIELRIVKETGEAAAGEVGAVQIRGANLFREYWNKADATRAAFATGWFDTGDLGSRDNAGFLTLVGRKNDLIITSGFNVYPQVVERIINECPGVKESVVLGVPDARRGERVVVAVVRDDPALDEAQLRAFWSDRLVDYQRPRDVYFVDALPRNAMGKVLRRELAEQLGKQS